MVDIVWTNEYDIAGNERMFHIALNRDAVPFQHEDFMFIAMVCVPSRSSLRRHTYSSEC